MDKKKELKKADYVILNVREDNLIIDTTTHEKFRVLKISQRISKYLSGLLFASGAVSVLLAAQYILGARLLVELQLKSVFISAVAFIGAINIVAGLLLLSKE